MKRTHKKIIMGMTFIFPHIQQNQMAHFKISHHFPFPKEIKVQAHKLKIIPHQTYFHHQIAKKKKRKKAFKWFLKFIQLSFQFQATIRPEIHIEANYSDLFSQAIKYWPELKTPVCRY
jgi:hypothetical protein